MGWASRQNKEDSDRQIVVVCPSTEVNNDFAAFASRTKKALQIMQRFIDAGCELDENAPDFEKKIYPLIAQLMFDFGTNYPTPNVLKTDIKTLSQVRILNK